jgi:uncharacterized ferritin-like protein (DUF455 family)
VSKVRRRLYELRHPAERGQEQVAKVFDYLLADEVPHVHNGVRWGTYLCDGDERAYRDRVRELRERLDRTGVPAS